MSALDWLDVAIGTLIVARTVRDLFQSVMLPRPAVGRFLLSRFLLRAFWVLWRGAGRRIRKLARREAFLAAFGPLMLPVLLVEWGAGLIFGYALIYLGLHDQVAGHVQSYGTSVYFSAEALLTLGFGDVVPTGAGARTLVMIEAATGLVLLGLLVSLLFLLFNAFQRRESAVVELDALAGAPPSGLQLLESLAEDASSASAIAAELGDVFNRWRGWSAEVLETHLAFPMLLYFRSSHDNEAWLNSFGAVMDAAALVLSGVRDGPSGAARLMYKVGAHLAEDLGWYYRYVVESVPMLERDEFDDACRRLAASGYDVDAGDAAWQTFVKLRSRYAPLLNLLSAWLAVAPAPWIGDRSYLPHRERRGRRRAAAATAG